MNKNEFFQSAARKAAMIEVNGHQMEIRSLSLPQREKLPEKIADNSALGVAWIVACGVSDFDEGDIDTIMDLDHEVLEKIASEILELSGLSPDSDDEAKND